MSFVQATLTTNLEVLYVVPAEFASWENSAVLGLREFKMDGREAGDLREAGWIQQRKYKTKQTTRELYQTHS